VSVPGLPPRLDDAGPALDRLLAGVDNVYTDLDGTLFGPGASIFAAPDGTRTLAVAEALVALLDAGVTVVPVSGRNRFQLLDDCRILGLRHFIAEVGALVVHDLHDEGIENLAGFPEPASGDTRSVVERIMETGVIDALFSAFAGKLEHHYPWSRHRDYSFILRGEVDADRARQVIAEATDLPLDFVDNGIIHPRTHCLVGCEIIHAYHVLPAGVSKASGVAKDLPSRGIAPERAVAIGDSASDVGVADEVAAFFLVGNGASDPRALEAAASRENVYVTGAEMGMGWREAALRLLAAR
jgi:hypothetical protein